MKRQGIVAGALLVAWLAAPSSVQAAPDEGQPPAFGVQTSAITVDVVVLDQDGRPVRGLDGKDFTILEDGRRQAVVGFEARDMLSSKSSAGEARNDGAEIGVSNEGLLRQPDRALALLVDDLGLSPLIAEQVKPALATWIRRDARAGDEITIMTTSGDVWWTDTVERGREDLLRALDRVRGKAFRPTAGETMSDFEAYRIAVYEQSTEGLVLPAARSRTPDVSGTVQPGLQGTMFFVSALHGSSTVERVTQRWVTSRVCLPCVDPAEMTLDCAEIRSCRQRVQNRAQEQYAAMTRRTTTLYDSVARLARGLADTPGRKAILLVSEELLQDGSRDLSERAVDACQRANVAVYFSGARGLTSGSLFAADADVGPRSQDVGAIAREEGVLATAGGVELAESTGGAAVTTSNDLAAGMEQMALDSSTYYLLGYQPEEAPDGKWHKLEVRVAQPGLEVRARKGYLATRPRNSASKSARNQRDKGPAGKTLLAPELLAGTAGGELPLRMATYVEDPSEDKGAARVKVVLEIDNSRVVVDRSVTPWTAALDITIVAASVESPPVAPVDERLDLSLTPEQVDSGWWLVQREMWLPPGMRQIRALVRDTASGTTGLVTERIVVPDAQRSYVSTPILTDRALPAPQPGAPSRLIPKGYRTFGQRPELFCQYEVFRYGGWTLPGVGQLLASHTLQRSDGAIVAEGPPTPIDTAAGRAVRRIALPLASLADGAYELTVTVQDDIADRTLVSRSAFRVERDATAP